MLSFILSLLLLATLTGDGGSTIDPNGATATLCDGAGLDPHGQPCTQQQLNTDDGNGFDPHG